MAANTAGGGLGVLRFQRGGVRTGVIAGKPALFYGARLSNLSKPTTASAISTNPVKIPPAFINTCG